MARSRSQPSQASSPSLWLPFDLEIGRLCQSATVAGENEEEEREQRQKRREMLERLFADAQAGNTSAAKATTAMDAVMKAFASKVEEVVRAVNWTGEKEPGTAALSLLSEDTGVFEESHVLCERASCLVV